MRIEQIDSLAWPEPNLHGQPVQFPRLAAHQHAWWRALAGGFRQPGFLFVAKADGGTCIGMLPLMLIKGPIFGRFLVSMPYINTGGVWARDQSVASSLLDSACALADRLDVRYLELRHEIPVSHKRLSATRTEKVHMRLVLPPSDEQLDASFKSKLRSQIRKAATFRHTIQWGGIELLEDFYDIFSINMRDLGTPVFSQQLFAKILLEFADQAELCIVRGDKGPAAAALLIHTNGVTEVPSASSLRRENHTGANMWMYRQLLKRAIDRKSHTFDFGRSSVASGTYKFKAQWGAQPHPAVWQYYVRKGSADAMRPNQSSNRRLIRIWQRLPVRLTRWIGPAIVRGIP